MAGHGKGTARHSQGGRLAACLHLHIRCLDCPLLCCIEDLHSGQGLNSLASELYASYRRWDHLTLVARVNEWIIHRVLPEARRALVKDTKLLTTEAASTIIEALVSRGVRVGE